MNKLYFGLFFLVFASFYFGMHYFVYRGVIKGLPVAPPHFYRVRIVFLLLALTFVLGEFLRRKGLFYPFSVFGSAWFGIIVHAFFFFLLKNIIVLLLPSQNIVLTRTAIVLTMLVSIWSFINVSLTPVTKKIELAFPGLPPELEGFSIAHLSDLHVVNGMPDSFLNNIVDETNAQKPDLIVITGDMIDADICAENGICASLRRLSSRHGVYAITGNHEFYTGLDLFLKISAEAKIKVLRQQNAVISDKINLIGIDDPAVARYYSVVPDIEKAMTGLKPGGFNILLNHQPVGFDEAVEKGVKLQLSGHTHWGQLLPLELLIYLIYRRPKGLYEKDGSYMYVSAGTGYWGPPMRFFSRSEIVNIVLRNKG